jgi:hypothetical protein
MWSLQTDDGSIDGNSSRCLWQGELIKMSDRFLADDTRVLVTTFQYLRPIDLVWPF